VVFVQGIQRVGIQPAVGVGKLAAFQIPGQCRVEGHPGLLQGKQKAGVEGWCLICSGC